MPGTRAASYDVELSCDEREPRELAVPGSGSVVVVRTTNTHSAWLRIEERGQDLLIEAVSQVRFEVQAPPRYGVIWVEIAAETSVQLTRTQPGAAAGGMRLSCVSTDTLGWDRELAALASLATQRVERDRLEVLQSSIGALRQRAPDAVRVAATIHLEAQMLLLNERTVAAARAFERAEAAWRDAHDLRRASAARAARAEDLQRSGDYAAVLALAAEPADDGDPYFEVRIEATRCLALRSLAQGDAAAKCLRGVLARFDTLGESLERLSALQDYALLLSDLGRASEAEALALDALQRLQQFPDVPGPGVPTVTGRTYLLLADLALRRGDIAAALSACAAALDAFDIAKVTRWEANSLLRAAQIYAALGAPDEAAALAEQARSLFSPHDAPARVAAAALVLAHLALGRGDVESAERYAAEAALTYDTLQMPTEREAARIVEFEAQLRRTANSTAGDIESALGIPHAANAVERGLLLARFDLEYGQLARMRKRLDVLASTPLMPQQRTQVARLAALYWERQGNLFAAQNLRWTAALQLRAAAWQASSPVLRMLLVRHVEALRRDALEALLAGSDGRADAAQLAWRWLVVDRFPPENVDVPRPSAAEFDGLLARELLLPNGYDDALAHAARARSQRALLRLLADSGRAGSLTVPEIATLEALSDSLHDGDAMVALVEGHVRTALLLISVSGARLLPIDDAPTLRRDVAGLSDLVSDPMTPVIEIEALGRDIARRLFGSAADAPPRIFVLANTGLDALPWTAMPWPATGVPLLDTTYVARVWTPYVRRTIPAAAPSKLVTLVAADPQERILPDLAFADAEPTLIRFAVPASVLNVRPVADASRDAILGAFAQSDAWVHLAAHGVSNPRRLGYSGVWTASRGQAEFVSWLDLLQRGVRAELVVLNACRLAQADDRSALGNLNFAQALAQAGSRNVIAALWPTSDTASGVWVPAFYRTLIAKPEPDAADALRVAQRQLRASRAFRHPAYWAALAHITTMR